MHLEKRGIDLVPRYCEEIARIREALRNTL